MIDAKDKMDGRTVSIGKMEIEMEFGRHAYELVQLLRDFGQKVTGGYDDGYEKGHNDGHDDGYLDGESEGRQEVGITLKKVISAAQDLLVAHGKNTLCEDCDTEDEALRAAIVKAQGDVT